MLFRSIDRLFTVLAQMKAAGTAIIYISHRLDEIVALADRCTVLRDGRLVTVRARGEFEVADLIEAMTGRVAEDEQSDVRAPGAALLSEQSPHAPIQLHAGQTLGIAGLLGSGADLKVRGLFGAGPEPVAVQLSGSTGAVLKQPSDAIAQGIGLVPGTRSLGLVLNQSIRDNILLPNLNQIGSVFRIDRARADALVNEMMDLLDIRPRRPEIRAGALSGGNQQKVILAKWLARDCDVLIVDEPTRGIDVGAKAEIYQLLDELAGEGKALLVISSELPELIGLCRRILVMREGRLAGEVARENFSEHGLLEIMAGVAAA